MRLFNLIEKNNSTGIGPQRVDQLATISVPDVSLGRVGKSGTGKSCLMGNMMISDMNAGYGLALIDPHGDLAEAMLPHVPERRIKDIIYLNASDLEHPIAFNPLEGLQAGQHDLVASHLITVFKKIWLEFWGPRMEHILRHSLLTLLELPGTTLLDLPKLLTDAGFRARVVSAIRSQAVRDFWYKEFDKYSAWFRSEATSPILNKVGQFLTNLPLRNIIGQPKSSFNLREAMDKGKILIVNLSKGRIGEDNCALLGAMIVTGIQLAALSRSDKPEPERRPFYFYVDEVHNFLTQSFADVLSESRKFGLSLTLSHQFTQQLHENLRSAIFGNVGTLISFRVGVEDAEVLAKEFSPVFNEEDLMSLPNYHIYLKLMIDGATSLPFSAVTMPLPSATDSHAEEVIRSSRHLYGRARPRVEQRAQDTIQTKSEHQQRLF